ncbi:MAG TPA: hypothetical protein VF332_09340 [Vicinamibacterales bacterium]
MASLRSWHKAADGLLADLRAVLHTRLRSLVVYEAHGLLGDASVTEDGGLQRDNHVHTLAIVDNLSYSDLAQMAPLAANWAERGLAVPLILAPDELRRSLDTFPLEFSQMIARHVVIAGEDPFKDLKVADADLRRACESQVRSHLLHLREGFIQSAGNPEALAALVSASVVPLRALLVNIARLHGVNARTPDALTQFAEQQLHLGTEGLRPLLSSRRPEQVRNLDVGAFFPAYLQAVEQLAALVDEWTR